MRWGAETAGARDASPATPRVGPGHAIGLGWLPARAGRPIFLLSSVILLVYGLDRMRIADVAPHLVAEPPAIHFDLNRDPLERLALIPGIGPRRARAIVKFRNAHGPFTCTGDLLRVPGVGPSLMRRLAPLLAQTSAARRAPSLATGDL